VDEAAENIGWAGGAAAAEQVNYSVDFWRNSDFEFLKKSMPRLGPSTAAWRKVAVKSLP
jgi:hypothetical protein